uniref:Uncharacterized protein n=1 Tax=Leishmania guyanensis TaxID=5670 RepID=A0A1E1IWX5_LEIGU|nr:Hypothetical protein BN36_2332970 [Leishmania guyanensis]
MSLSLCVGGYVHSGASLAPVKGPRRVLTLRLCCLGCVCTLYFPPVCPPTRPPYPLLLCPCVLCTMSPTLCTSGHLHSSRSSQLAKGKQGCSSNAARVSLRVGARVCETVGRGSQVKTHRKVRNALSGCDPHPKGWHTCLGAHTHTLSL